MYFKKLAMHTFKDLYRVININDALHIIKYNIFYCSDEQLS